MGMQIAAGGLEASRQGHPLSQTMEPLADTIRGISIFSGLSREDVAKVLGKMEELNLAAGETIVRQGDQGDAFYLIQSGAVQVVVDSGAGNSEIVAILGPQDCFGEMALFSGEPRSATIVTVKDSILWRLSRQDWDELIDKYPSWLLQLCATLSKRLAYVDRQYSTGREAFNSLAEEFYAGSSPRQQEFFRHASLLHAMDGATVEQLFQSKSVARVLADLSKSQSPLGAPSRQRPHRVSQFLQRFFARETARHRWRGNQAAASRHISPNATPPSATGSRRFITPPKCRTGPKSSSLSKPRVKKRSPPAAQFVKNILERIPREYFIADTALVNLKSDILIQLGDLPGAFRAYQEVLAQRAAAGEAVASYRRIAETLARRKEYGQAIGQLRSALSLIERDMTLPEHYADVAPEPVSLNGERTRR